LQNYKNKNKNKTKAKQKQKQKQNKPISPAVIFSPPSPLIATSGPTGIPEVPGLSS
jgi:hypothetical protein